MLEVSAITAGYGEGVVLDGLSLSVGAGERLALLGRNGAGKSTLLKSIMGLVRARQGTITFDGQRIDRLPPHRVARAGIGYVPQGREIFTGFTVEENLQLGDTTAGSVHEGLDIFPALAERRGDDAGALSGGQQQQLAIARALIRRPKLLLLDEPSEGIQPSIVAEIGETLRRLAEERGTALLLVEQNVDLTLDLCDTVVFVERGQIADRQPAKAVRDDPGLVDTYLAF